MSEYDFDRRSLEPATRRDGISGFMRTRNGARFLRAAIESHVGHFDEIVAVYNDCTDETPGILQELASEYPDKLKVYEYEPTVYPPGTSEHRMTPSNSVHAMANYSNYALSKTTRRVAVPLDDDFLAIERNLARAVETVRKRGLAGTALCFSGLNLLRAADGAAGVFYNVPFSGNKDWFFFPVSERTCWSHTEKYEVLQTPGLKKRYAGVLNFHLKYLKNNYGLDNYRLDENPGTWRSKLLEFLQSEERSMPLKEFLSLDPHYYLRPDTPGFMQAIPEGKYRTARRIDRVLPVLGLVSFFRPGDIYLARALRLKEDLQGVCIPAGL
jgi:hypothetical protein